MLDQTRMLFAVWHPIPKKTASGIDLLRRGKAAAEGKTTAAPYHSLSMFAIAV